MFSILTGLLFFGAICATLVYTFFGVVVPPDSIGVRINYFSLGFLDQGYSKDGLTPGLHLRFPGVSDIVLLPRGFRFINLGKEFVEGDLELPPLQVQSSNGPRVNTGVTLAVRFFSDEVQGGPKEIALEEVPDGEPVPLPKHQIVAHGGPENMITFFGADPVEQLTKITRIARNELGKSLSELSSSDFYNPERRERETLKAHQAINRTINPYGVELAATLIRRYTYEKEEIDNQIFAKNLQTQTAKLRIAQTKFAEVTAKIEKTKEAWNQKVQEKNVEAEAYLLRKQSEARFNEETKIAEGEQVYQSKLAEITLQKNKLLSEMPGADIYIARSMVPMIKTLSGGVVSNVDPYDVDSWAKKLVGMSRGREGSQ